MLFNPYKAAPPRYANNHCPNVFSLGAEVARDFQRKSLAKTHIIDVTKIRPHTDPSKKNGVKQ